MVDKSAGPCGHATVATKVNTALHINHHENIGRPEPVDVTTVRLWLDSARGLCRITRHATSAEREGTAIDWGTYTRCTALLNGTALAGRPEINGDCWTWCSDVGFQLVCWDSVDFSAVLPLRRDRFSSASDSWRLAVSPGCIPASYSMAAVNKKNLFSREEEKWSGIYSEVPKNVLQRTCFLSKIEKSFIFSETLSPQISRLRRQFRSLSPSSPVRFLWMRDPFEKSLWRNGSRFFELVLQYSYFSHRNLYLNRWMFDGFCIFLRFLFHFQT